MTKIGYFALSVFLVVATIFVSSLVKSEDSVKVYATTNVERSGLSLFDENIYDEKVYDTTTLEDDFADDTISVVLNRQTSRSLKTYTVKDFPEIRLSQVRHVATHTEENVRQQLLKMRNTSISQVETQNNNISKRNSDININTFRQSIRLTLKEPSKENVLKAIRLLEKRSDVYGVSPNHIIHVLPLLEEAECELHESERELNDAIASKTSNNYQTSNGGYNWGVDMISAPAAWNFTKGSNSVTVGVIDSGIQANHPDLQSLIHPDMSLHKDFVGNNALQDPRGHGTHVRQITV